MAGDSVTIKAHCIGLLRNTGFILALALIAGLTLEKGASWTEPAVTPVLGIMMTLSMMEFSPKYFLNFKKLLFPILSSLFLSYIVLGGTIIGLSSLIIQDDQLLRGFVILAAVPPAVATIAFTYNLGGNINYTVVGVATTYLAAIFITPLVYILFLGTNLIEPGKLLIILAELVVAPLIVSQILRRMSIAPTLERGGVFIVNWCFFIIAYTVIGLNKSTFLVEPVMLLFTSIVAFFGTFALIHIIDYISRLFGVDRHDRISIILLGTQKNIGLAAALSLIFFGARAAMPSAVYAAISIISFIWLSLWIKKIGQR